MKVAPAVVQGTPAYDAIVIGARCAGSPTAMLLARAGYKVLVVDRSTFPSDWMRAHFVRNAAVQCLERWGLMSRVLATGCPAVTRWIVDMGDFPLPMPGAVRDGGAPAIAPRRFVLDQILVEAAIEAGAEVRQGFSVQELLFEDGRVVGIRGREKGGREVTERARIVIGADGLHSLVARAVQAPVYDAHPTHACCYYTYFGDVPMAELQLAFQPDRVVIASPTNDDLTLVAVAAPIAEFPRFKTDIERAFFDSLTRAPWIEEQILAGRRAERWLGTGDLPNFFRKPFGPGWALVGDAGYHRDPIPARGISDAFRDAELLTEALDAGFSGRAPLETTLADYERRRNEAARPTFQEALDRSQFLPFPPEILAQRAALRTAA